MQELLQMLMLEAHQPPSKPQQGPSPPRLPSLHPAGPPPDHHQKVTVLKDAVLCPQWGGTLGDSAYDKSVQGLYLEEVPNHHWVRYHNECFGPKS